MSMVQDGHQLQSETKTPTGKHVCVDYSTGTFGDLLRCFISLHNGFDKITAVIKKNYYGFNLVDCQPNKKINFKNVKNLKDYNLVFDKKFPNTNQHRQCYKIKSALPLNNIHGHSTINDNGREHKFMHPLVKEDWNNSEYKILRQTDHKIIFVILSPYSSYKNTYLKRKALWAPDLDLERHLKIWTKNYLSFEYPKHELNYELEINNLLDNDDETYYNLIKFLDVKPLNNWKDHLNIMKNKVC